MRIRMWEEVELYVEVRVIEVYEYRVEVNVDKHDIQDKLEYYCKLV